MFDGGKIQLLRQAHLALASSRPLLPQQVEARRMSLAEFTKQAWHIVEPATKLQWNWHLDALCDHIQALLEGRLAKRNLLLLVPPGFTKSTTVSVMAPSWWWINHPWWRAIFASGNDSVALCDSVKCRDIIESGWYARTFGVTWSLADDQNAKGYYRNTAQGFRMATTAGAKVTGDRAHALFCDDANDAADAHRKTARDTVNYWWDQALSNRVADAQTGTRVIVCQRLHPQDLPGHVLEVEPENWEVLSIPQEWEESRRTATSLNWTDPRTVEGTLAFPERFPANVVAVEKVRLGTSGYAGQHQQRPTIQGGELFQRVYLQLLDELPICSQIIISVDSAFKVGQENDFSVALVMGQFDRGVAVLEMHRHKYTYPMLKTVITELGERVKPSALLAEDKASGQSLIQDLQLNTVLPVKAVPVDGDKLMRANICVPGWEAGRVFALRGSPWLDDFLDEVTQFPKSVHDDIVDALVQGLRFLTLGGADVDKYVRVLTQQDTAAADAAVKVALSKRPGATCTDITSEGHTWH